MSIFTAAPGVWAITGHMCRVCAGRMLMRLDGVDAGRLHRCSLCGTETRRRRKKLRLPDTSDQHEQRELGFHGGEPVPPDRMTTELRAIVLKGGGVTAIAKKAGLTRQTLSRALSKRGHPEWDTLKKVMQVLGLRIALSPTSTNE